MIYLSHMFMLWVIEYPKWLWVVDCVWTPIWFILMVLGILVSRHEKP